MQYLKYFGRVSVLIVIGVMSLAQVSYGEDSVAKRWNEELLEAIRLDFPAPTVHSRNLFHISAAMYDAWAAYDCTGIGYFYDEPMPLDGLDTEAAVKAAREEAISYAAYRMLLYRYSEYLAPTSAEITEERTTQLMIELGYDPNYTATDGGVRPHAELGNKIADLILTLTQTDNSNELDVYEENVGYVPVNFPLVFELPGASLVHHNRWQPLAFDHLILQNGIVIGTAIQEFVGPHWGYVTPFAMFDDVLYGAEYSWSSIDPGQPPQLGGLDDDLFRQDVLDVIRYSSVLDPSSSATIDLSPAVYGNRPMASRADYLAHRNGGPGHPVNPVTGLPYTPNVVNLADYGRCVAEFWADGPRSETPPGHWNTLANFVSDHPLMEKRIGGVGPVVDNLEWDCKLYFILNGGMHDAAVAAWGTKEKYDYIRPISMIRYMCGNGQSSDLALPSYHPLGITLEPGLVELIDSSTTAPGGRHEHLAGHEGEIAIYAWKGEPADPETQYGGVGWILGETWLTYQLSTFVTPAFAAYVSGHSTFSRNGAEIMTAYTGSPYFPGGLGTWTFEKHEALEFELGPSESFSLTWATYQDAADEAGISRLYGGIHVVADDVYGRIMGEQIGKQAFAHGMTFIKGNCPVKAPMKFTPQALNLNSQGNWVKCTIILPEPITSADINLDSFLCEGQLAPISVTPDQRIENNQSETGDKETYNLQNFSHLAGQWLASLCNTGNDWCQNCDFDRDGGVGQVDLRFASDHWLRHAENTDQHTEIDLVFDRAAAAELLDPGHSVEVTVACELKDGRQLIATDTIKVIGRR
jgi:hypothetical protein